MTRFCWRCGTALPAAPPTACVACGQAHYLNPLPCGEAVVLRDGEVLLLRRAADPYRGAWDVPGGFCEADEHPMRAAERELAEELGLTGRAIAYVGTWMDAYGEPEADGVQVQTVTSSYIIELDDPGQPPTLQPDEAIDAGWFPVDALPADLAFPEHARPMLAAVAARLDGSADALPDRTW